MSEQINTQALDTSELICGIFVILPVLGRNALYRGERQFHRAISRIIPDVEKECKDSGINNHVRVRLHDISEKSEAVSNGIQSAVNCLIVSFDWPQMDVLRVQTSSDFARLYFGTCLAVGKQDMYERLGRRFLEEYDAT